jgi:predicted transcriptional regulator
MLQHSSTIEVTMTGISLNLPEDLSKSLADLANTNGQTPSYLAMDVLRDYIEHERTLTAQIELAVKEADQGKFATDEQVAAMRARRWNRNAIPICNATTASLINCAPTPP